MYVSYIKLKITICCVSVCSYRFFLVPAISSLLVGSLCDFYFFLCLWCRTLLFSLLHWYTQQGRGKGGDDSAIFPFFRDSSLLLRLLSWLKYSVVLCGFLLQLCCTPLHCMHNVVLSVARVTRRLVCSKPFLALRCVSGTFLCIFTRSCRFPL